MNAANTIVGWLQFVSWLALGIAAYNVWRHRRDAAATWLAAGFVTLAAIVVAARFLPQDPNADIPQFVLKTFLVAIVVFPYFLYRFVFSFVEAKRWERVLVDGITLTLLAFTVVAPRFPKPGEARALWVIAFTILFATQWAVILLRISLRLWSAARGQPAVARRRMYTMGIGAAGFALAIVVAVVFPQTSASPTIASIVSQVISLAAGPFFLLGFAPPRVVRVIWRRDEDIAVRQMEIGLAGSLSRAEIAKSFAAPIAELLGGQGAALIDNEDRVVGSHHLEPAEIVRALHRLPRESELYHPTEAGAQMRALRMENGWLLVSIGAFTPFFGTDELQMLSASAVVADLALGRAELFELERRSRDAMRDFVAIASHDLRTPVTVIQGLTELMSTRWDDFSTEQRRHFIDAIARQTGHLDRLIFDLLTTSKLDVGELGAFPERIDANDVVAEAIASVSEGADVAVDSASPGAAIFADPDHVTRIVQNLVKNALVYGAPPVRVSLTSEDGSIVVRVSDNGAGVAPEFVPRLFEKFARADKKKSDDARGTGLGLSIVRGLAQANGGDAWYEPNTEAGATFAFRLPLVDAQTPTGERVHV